MQKLILFTSLLLCLFLGKCMAQTTFVCPEKDGLFANPANASSYYQCSNGYPNLQPCPGNLVFNATALDCEFGSGGQTTSNSTSSPLCPKDGYFAHPTDPHKFYECSNGLPNMFNCSDNLIFNATINACNFDPNAPLPTSSGSTTPRVTTVPPPATASVAATVTTTSGPPAVTTTKTFLNKILTYFFQ